MRIVRDYNSEYKVTPIKINKAEYLGNFKIKIIFSNEAEKTVNFKTFLCNSLHPAIKKYTDENKFNSFSIVDGNLNWNDYDMIFPIEDLLKGKI